MQGRAGISLLSALLTGAFCAVFAIVLNVLLPTMSVAFLLASAGTSGFLGSLFAQTVMRNRK
ncbi:hypothetical protein PSA7680_00022 [Pseudoruegeria aquimaris]|uniref:Uncharacterized protein n=1 Tax=Pseudoruegeria aquimaris TaxID=393663 RepID=A0A1Y5R6G2_9RHOB|nr:hypothetical protein [Pseudoruegeria aquimaris]SLN10355.1 hypothetical protein PSA7680_00022 [Pseudoruegeria aquimaris]